MPGLIQGVSSHYDNSHFVNSHFVNSHYDNSHFVNSHFVNSHYDNSHLVNFPLRQFPTLSIPIWSTLTIPIWSTLTKWELTKWEVGEVGIDKVYLKNFFFKMWCFLYELDVGMRLTVDGCAGHHTQLALVNIEPAKQAIPIKNIDDYDWWCIIMICALMFWQADHNKSADRGWEANMQWIVWSYGSVVHSHTDSSLDVRWTSGSLTMCKISYYVMLTSCKGSSVQWVQSTNNTYPLQV